MYAEIDRELEERAFDEIASTAPRLPGLLGGAALGDPCLEEVAEAVSRAAPRLGLRLVLAFGSLARRGCGRDVDLVVLDLPVDPALAKGIVDSWRLLYGSPREAELEVLRLYKVYLDWREALRRGM